MTSKDNSMALKYNFEKSISEDMSLPGNDLSIHALNAGYAVLIRTMNNFNPGIAQQVLENLDKVYLENDGNADFQLALAQLAAMTKMMSFGE